LVLIIVEFVVSAAVIVAAGVVLTRCSDTIAEITGMGRLLAGSLLLALATSLPELSVDLNAVRMGLPDLAIGDLMGSSLFNLLILGSLDIAVRSPRRMLSRASAAHALSGAVVISVTALASGAILVGPKLGSWTVAGVGVGSLAVLVAYALGVRMVFLDQRISARAAVHDAEEAGLIRPSLRGAVLGYIGSAAVIIVTGPFLAGAAGEIAERSGLGNTFVGTTLVALCTSLPELTTTLAAVRMGALDLALGNIFGSNAFNMVLVVPLDMMHPGSLLSSVSPTHAVTGLATIVVTSVAVMGQLYQADTRKRFIEPDAALVIALVLGALGLVYFLG